jgi:hypothetical protein
MASQNSQPIIFADRIARITSEVVLGGHDARQVPVQVVQIVQEIVVAHPHAFQTDLLPGRLAKGCRRF